MIKLTGHIDEHYKDTICGEGIKKDLVWLWNKLVDYGNYWQLHSPTVNGNIDFSCLRSWIDGFCAAKGWDWEETDNKIKVSKNKKIILDMDINPKPKTYYEDLNEIRETLREIYGN